MSHDVRQFSSSPPPRQGCLGLILAPVRWIVEKILVLYYVGTDPKVSPWAKRGLATSLLYVFSLGIILDFLPPIGEEIDFIAFLIAAGSVAFSIKPYHTYQAKAKARQLFGGPSPPAPPPSSSIPPLLKP
jgi:hypothetical protein